MASGEDPLSRLEARLDAASEAAGRLIAEAAEAAVRRPPPAGWQRVDNGDGERSGAPAGELELLLEAVNALRDRIPPDLQRRLGEALHDLLLAIRALIDWYLERAAHQRREAAEVQDIPIA